MAPPRKKRPKQTDGLVLVVDGVTHVVRPSEITAEHVGIVRKETGRSLRSVMDDLNVSLDIDVVAVFVWLALQQVGQTDRTIAQVAKTITYASTIGPGEAPDDDEDDDSPEA